MSKFIEALREKNRRAVEKEKTRLENQLKEAKEFYNDTGYDRYFNKMNKLEAQLEELREFIGENETTIEQRVEEIKQSREYLQMIKAIKSKWEYMMKDFNLPLTAEIIGITDILRDVK